MGLKKLSKQWRERQALSLQELYALQKGTCFLCGGFMLPSPVRKKRNGQHDHGYSVEHVIPRVAGGGGGENRALTHIQCNGKKRDTMPTNDQVRLCKMLHLRIDIDTARACIKNS